jgi:hypothetical protein
MPSISRHSRSTSGVISSLKVGISIESILVESWLIYDFRHVLTRLFITFDYVII